MYRKHVTYRLTANEEIEIHHGESLAVIATGWPVRVTINDGTNRQFGVAALRRLADEIEQSSKERSPEEVAGW